jgi:hypothetical protein
MNPILFKETVVYATLRNLLKLSSFEVFQLGATSSLTTGDLLGIVEDRQGLNQPTIMTLSNPNLDVVHTYQLIIGWRNNSRFSRDGDSGSLVYTKHQVNKDLFIVPLGILHGSNEKKRESYAWLLGSFLSFTFFHPRLLSSKSVRSHYPENGYTQRLAANNQRGNSEEVSSR